MAMKAYMLDMMHFMEDLAPGVAGITPDPLRAFGMAVKPDIAIISGFGEMTHDMVRVPSGATIGKATLMISTIPK